MHALLDERSRRAHPLPAFRRAYARSARTATLIRVEAGEPGGEDDGTVAVPVTMRTRVFGVIGAACTCRCATGASSGARA